MQKIISGITMAVLLFLVYSCTDDKQAEKPVYITLEEINVRTNYAAQGTASHNITTAWLYAGTEPIGAFELPFTVPVILPPGQTELTIYPGVNINGISSVRVIYDAYEPIRLNVTNPASAEKLDTIFIDQSEAITEYRSTYAVKLVEGFDDTGLNLEPLEFSDTTFIKVDHPDSAFYYKPPYSNQAENNGSAGMLVLTDKNNTIEFGSVTEYQVPLGAQNLFLEANYKTDIELSFGLIAELGAGEDRAITATLFPKDEWSKIHIDLITELQANPGARGYKVYIVAQKPKDGTEARIFLDNIKLAYRE